MRYLRLWAVLAVVIIGSFTVLSYYGLRIYRQAPPIPQRVVAADSRVLFTASDLQDGQNVWQSIGGQEVGSIWGHGAYVAPDWNADWLHRESLFLLDRWALADHGQRYDALSAGEQAALRARLTEAMRTNTYDPATGDLVLSADRAAAFEALSSYYGALFGDADAFPESVRAYADGGFSPQKLREAYAIPRNTVPDATRRQQMSAFFFWSTWATTANRPGSDVSYTQNWPAESLVANAPTGSIVIWSLVSFVLLLAGIGALVWHHATLKHDKDDEPRIPGQDPLLALQPTPSMKATLKYFWVVVGLILAQVGLGVLTAHYGVEGEGFFGFPLAEYLPYSVTRTWHTQLGIFWIATAWLATGLFIAPAVSGYEPRFQRAGVNFLFVCLLLIVVGSCFGTWYATRQQMGHEMNFWFGHQGYEYVDLGRFWQLFLFVGLFVWLGLMTRAIWPAFKKPGENKHMLGLFLLSSSAIALFYGAGLMWGRHTHLAMAEYWRWWVVHLWVEGFFEVFATVVIAFLFTRMGLLRTAAATASVLFATSIFLAGGIIGTFHHLYFSGTPTAVLALGAVFSALEVVPLTLIGFEAYENLALTRARPWVSAYRWPICFFVAVAFWNLVGAGLFGFLINPPIALYYMQGMNTTPVHGHTALFGVYGMLGIGLTLFCLKGLTMHKTWRTGSLKLAFWSLNLGLVLMVVLSMLPVGLMQAWASVENGVWYARSAEFLQTDLLQALRWMRVFGDITFSVGIAALAWFVLGLVTGWSLQRQTEPAAVTSDLQPAVQHA
ncbi:MAG: nitric-oxide reductase large subunit [Phycisphaeraceae bacterium]|nr:nitric-oxide reductase large subunit [Phycisphaeraceae bacterium]